MSVPSPPSAANPDVWWWNAGFFISVHIAAILGVWLYPYYAVHRATLALAFALFQISEISITVGYHRLYSHRSFRAARSVRVFLALMGAGAMQGSIKRFTDDPVHDPYAATRGLLWSHMGWIFFKPRYDRLKVIEQDDLRSDPVPLALLIGFVLPPVAGWLWGDPYGAFVWGALVARVLIWHCTFFVNSSPGGATLLRKHSVRIGSDPTNADDKTWQEADWAFHGGYNIHTRAAHKRMRALRVAKISGLDIAKDRSSSI
ncbi:predicted protein [Postia placenta Mad-698-R]|nr:predicted protein [Postia placenta Mad-698-R]